MLRLVRVQWLALMALLAVGLQSVLAADRVAAENRFPSTTVVFIKVHNATELSQHFGESSLGKLFHHEGMQKFMGQFEEQITEIKTNFQQEAGLSIDDIQKMFNGEIAFGVFSAPGAPIAVGLTIDVGEESKAAAEKILSLVAEKAPTAKEEDVEGTKFVVIRPEEGAPPAAQVFHLAIGVKDNTLLITSHVNAAKQLLSRWDGEQDRILADKPVFKHIMDRCKSEEGPSQISWFIDPIGLLKSGLSMPGIPTGGAMITGFLPTLGLDRLKGMGGTSNFNVGEYDAISQTFIYMDELAGVLGALNFPNTNITPPNWVKENASSYSGLNWDFAGAYTAVETIYDGFLGVGGLGNAVDAIAEDPNGPKLHIKKDLIDQLTGMVHVYTESTEDSDKMAFAFGVKDETAFAKVLKAITDLPGFPGEIREFQGKTIVEFEVPGAAIFTGGGDDDSGKFGLAVVGNSFVFSTDATILEDIIRGNSEDTLVESEVFKQHSKFFPAMVSSISYSSPEATIGKVYEMLRTQDLPLPNLDLSLLPEFSEIKEFFIPTAGYSVQEEKGNYSVSFSLKD